MDQSWIRYVVSKAQFHAPDGTAISYTDKNKGYIIDRAKMQKDLAETIVAMGADCFFTSRVTSVGPWSGNGRKVNLEGGKSTSAGVVIDASGPLSTIGKSEEIAWKSLDLEPAYFAVVGNVDLPTDAVHIHVSKTLAPGGYAWVFPREEGVANIGVLVGRTQCKEANLRTLLEAFLSQHYPKGKVLRRFAGTIPCGYQRRTIAIRGLVKAGDAASTINPISRAGIVEALMSGRLAGECAIQLLGTPSDQAVRRIAKAYEKAWFEKRGKSHQKLSNVKTSLAGIPDEDYNRAVRALAEIPHHELTMSKIFRVSLGRFPRLVWAMRHLM